MRFLKLFAFLTAAALTADPFDPSFHLQELETQGFTIVSGVFDNQEIQEISKSFEKIKARAFEIIENTEPKVRLFSENNNDNTSVYWKTNQELIMQAGKGRYDLYQGFKDDFFSSSQVTQNPKIHTLMKELLVDEFTNYSGIIHSMPGSEDQYWHRDTHTLANTGSDGSKLIGIDDFYFTVLIPINVPFTLENGTTEFLAGSHRLAAKDFKDCIPKQFEVPLGSALIFNGKINHRGKANGSEKERPALYLVYHKKWYNDQYRKGIL